MARLSNPQGLLTKVPYLFNNMLRKIIKDSQPDYIAVVFDPSGPTFRDALNTDYVTSAVLDSAAGRKWVAVRHT